MNGGSAESERLAELYSYNILDTPDEPEFDELTSLASEFFSAPIVVINFIDSDRQWFKSEIGLGVRETPMETSFCVHALLQQDLMIIPNALEDERFANNPLVNADTGLRFYAGALLKSPRGLALGTLCILDYQPREFTARQQRALQTMANQVMAQLEQRRALQESETTKRELSKLNQQLYQRDASRERIMAMISHEMRNPLSPIMMTLDALGMKAELDPDVGKGLATIRRQAKHLVRLVDDLLDTSRTTAGKISLQKNTRKLKPIIDRCVEMVSEELDRKQHKLQIILLQQNIWICADDTRIGQLITNLLNNAIRYTPAGGHIVLQAQQQDRQNLQLSVSDNGIGIAQDYLEEIFESFAQAPKTGGHTGGLGVGLHLCKHIVQLHEGEITAKSNGDNCGSTFLVTLPIIDDKTH